MTETFTWTFDEAAARAWMSAHADDGDWFLDPGFTARSSDSISDLTPIVQLAQEEGWLTCSANDRFDLTYNEVHLVYDADEDGGYLSWFMYLSLPDERDVIGQRRLALRIGGCDPWKVGDPDAVGADAVVSVLKETLSYARAGVADLAAFVAAWR